jgi:hypothetical protein
MRRGVNGYLNRYNFVSDEIQAIELKFRGNLILRCGSLEGVLGVSGEFDPKTNDEENSGFTFSDKGRERIDDLRDAS